MDEKIKVQAIETLAEIGLSVSDPLRVFLMRVVAEKQMPFALKVTKVETRDAIAEANQIALTRRAGFGTSTKLFDDLEKKTAASKRALLPQDADYTKSFLKDREHLSRARQYDMNRLKVNNVC
ncbi:hypothetical protein BJP41_04065 [Candidatus Williamhamiltonella defendens]|uniref:Type II toxin-antitoxin system antitoxin, RelB/DinJ family n=1 Tax=Candidatus Williamhamiltonella defendens TaxID=138072 RepID=A0A2D3T1I8_9ENTR|nr:type II toxin-antitoxin system RelB/DinJ family antitoxin [Candidatus Hamiltonella defensa]ATW29657.1 hypothetical protein BJP41_04065 [Candidatus Hamiltonella defensa]ATW31635.1 hypothetical protein BJP42_04145 [Candidatus Hamiltonella defensa]